MALAAKVLQNIRMGLAITPSEADTIYAVLNQQTVASSKVVFANGLTVTTGGATITAGGLTVTAGGITVAAGVSNFSAAGIKTIQAVTDVHDTVPTAANCVTAFGAAATVGRGFIGTIDDADADARGFLVFASDASYYFIAATKCA